MKIRALIFVVFISILLVLVASQITVFVVQPIGAIPDGRTLILERTSATKMIDSADAMCERLQGSVNLLCRGMILGEVVQNTKIYARLPYSEWLYLLSTGGVTYSN